MLIRDTFPFLSDGSPPNEGLGVYARDGNKADNLCQVGIDAVREIPQDGPHMTPDGAPAAGETIGQRLKRLRLERGLSQRELAAPGVSYAYISRIEAGTRQPSVKALRRLAGKLGVTADYLETGSDLDDDSARELRLTDVELAVRLGEAEGAEPELRDLAREAAAAGDRKIYLRAHVALAALAQERGDHTAAVSLLEDALQGEPFDPVSLADTYSQLARAYVSSGRTRAAVELFERCLAEVESGDDPALEARYATTLSYALSDMGNVTRAEEVVQRALERSADIEDPYMRVRLYWSMARLAHHEGRSSAALENVRKAIALLRLTDDTFHLARANLLAASIALTREEVDAAGAYLDQAESLLGPSPALEDLFELRVRRSRIAALRGNGPEAVRLAREAVELVGSHNPADEGLAFGALGDALALSGETPGADEAYRRSVALLEEQGRWRDASAACRAWARMLRQVGREQQALDVLDRAAELGLRATPADARVER
jgi:transcriptional regulator with XRE-family HTH domain